jgi:hypothetical protein
LNFWFRIFGREREELKERAEREEAWKRERTAKGESGERELGHFEL